jgi:DNA-binding NarL/FixJ family response regulator
MAAVAAGVTSVLVVDDDPLVRSALTLMLGGDDALTVVGEASDGAEGLAASRELQPDVVLMDIRMPVMNGIDATRTLKETEEAPHVIVLTTFDADEHVLSALEAGADGFLLKDTPPAEIVAAIQAVADGEPMLSPSATRAVLTRIRESSPDGRGDDARRALDTLTDRERDVALEVGRGLSNAEIANRLHLSVPTVKAHVSRLFDKLRCTNRVQIAIVVHDAGLL